MELREDANYIIKQSIDKVLPDEAVQKALREHFIDNEKYAGKNIYVVAIGKAAWKMADATHKLLENKIVRGFVITKYDHVESEIPNFKCMEAGHPVPDQNSFDSTKNIVDFVSDLGDDDVVVFLISGGGSALFESPLVPNAEMDDITRQLLSCGASIDEMNIIRKRLSAVKGGKFAQLCAPASVFSVVLSDVVGDRLDSIASGPAYPDASTADDARNIVEKYKLRLSDEARALMDKETPKNIDNVETHITGSVSELCAAAAQACKDIGYAPIILTDKLTCEAKRAGAWLADIGLMLTQDADEVFDVTYFACLMSAYTDKEKQNTIAEQIGLACRSRKPIAIIAGGETVVKLTGNGLGGRNQEIALAAAPYIDGNDRLAVFSVGSDGTDGPTDAAGGYVDGTTVKTLKDKGIDVEAVLANNDSYHGLQACGGLIKTGPTGTNVNDVSVCLISRQQ